MYTRELLGNAAEPSLNSNIWWITAATKAAQKNPGYVFRYIVSRSHSLLHQVYPYLRNGLSDVQYFWSSLWVSLSTSRIFRLYMKKNPASKYFCKQVPHRYTQTGRSIFQTSHRRNILSMFRTLCCLRSNGLFFGSPACRQHTTINHAERFWTGCWAWVATGMWHVGSGCTARMQPMLG